MSNPHTNTISSHLRLLPFLSLTSRLSTFLLITLLSTTLPLFDSSPSIPSPSSPLLRWDAFHFAHIAQNGYVHEYEWAFFPGTPLVMRVAGELLRFIKRSISSGGGPNMINRDDLLLGGALAAFLCDVDSTTTLYRLTLHHFKSPHIALITSVLSLLPSSPATLRFAPYSEPFFTYLSYKGMLCCARSQWFPASIYFALAGTFRSNGILLSGFIIWGLVIDPFLNRKHVPFRRVFYSIMLTAVTFIPFIYHHISAYTTYCLPSPSPAPPPKWCTSLPPSIYTHVQSKYWSAGFMTYYTPSQIPNFIISAPVFVLVGGFCGWFVRYGVLLRVREFLFLRGSETDKEREESSKSPFLSPTITPHAIHASILTLTILLTSHVQIILRQAASMPITYWAAAWLVVDGAGEGAGEKRRRWRWGRWWVGWSFVWGMVSLVLWVAFLPPA